MIGLSLKRKTERKLEKWFKYNHTMQVAIKFSFLYKWVLWFVIPSWTKDDKCTRKCYKENGFFQYSVYTQPSNWGYNIGMYSEFFLLGK